MKFSTVTLTGLLAATAMAIPASNLIPRSGEEYAALPIEARQDSCIIAGQAGCGDSPGRCCPGFIQFARECRDNVCRFGGFIG